MTSPLEAAKQRQSELSEPSALAAAKVRQTEMSTEQPQDYATRRLAMYPEGSEVVHQTDKGIVVKDPSGELSFDSPGFVTKDPATISEIMGGGTGKEAIQSQFYQGVIEQHPVAARGAAAIQGVPLVGEYAEEAVGKFSPAAGEAMRLSQTAMREEHPGQTAALQFGAAIVATIPAVMALPASIAAYVPAGMLQKIGLGAVVGGASGAIEGAVSGYGAGNDGDRVQSAKTRAAWGGGLGMAAGALVPVATTLVKGVATWFGDRPIKAAAKELNVSTGTARILSMISNATDEADARKILRQMGDDALLADMSPAAQGVLDTLMQSWGEAGQVAGKAISGRARDVGETLVTTLDDVMGAPTGRLTLKEAIRKGSKSTVSDAYKAAYSEVIDYSADAGQDVMGVIARINPKSLSTAIEDANARIRWDNVPVPEIKMTVRDGVATFDGELSVAHLDYIKKAFNNVTRGGTDPITGKMTPDAGFAADIARELRDATATASPSYRKALTESADMLGRESAVDTGSAIMAARINREQAIRMTRGMTPAEKKAAVEGARNFIDEQLANVRRTITDPDVDSRQVSKLIGDLSSDNSRAKLAVLVGPKKARLIIKELERAGIAMNLRAAAAVNSRTFGREVARQMVDDVTSGDTVLRVVGKGKPVGAAQEIVKAMTAMTDRDIALRKAGIYADVAEALVEIKGPLAARALTLLKGIDATKPISMARARTISKALQGGLVASATTGQRNLADISDDELNAAIEGAQ